MVSTMIGESGYERLADDKYYTPAWVTEALIRQFDFPWKMIWEPAAGNGAMSTPLAQAGFHVLTTDISPEAKFVGQSNFLEAAALPDDIFTIVTNPPFTHAKAFVEKALDLTEGYRGIVAMLLRNEWDSASTRMHLFNHPAFRCKIVLTRRPQWFPESTTGPRHNFSWFIWDWAHSGKPYMVWDKGSVG